MTNGDKYVDFPAGFNRLTSAVVRLRGARVVREIPAYETDNATFWRGHPDYARGELLKAQFEKRKEAKLPYVHLHLAEIGRRGAPWGTMFLEVSGTVYHFRARMTAIERHVINSVLTEEGKRLVASGVAAQLDNEISWKWVQESVSLSGMFAAGEVMRLKSRLDKLLRNQALLPRYQAYQYALERGIAPDPTMHNCASYFAQCLDFEAPLPVARMPALLFEHVVGAMS